MKFALIQNGLVHELFDAKPVLHPDIQVVKCGPDIQVGWTYDGSTFAAPIDPPRSRDDIVAQAKAALLVSDRVAIHCLKAGTAYPADWLAHDDALRAIIAAGAEPDAWPSQPPYPS